MAAVQFAAWSVDRDIDLHDAPCSESDQLLAGLRDGAIADEPDIGREEIFVGREDLFEIDRARFFLAFEDEADVGVELESGGADGVERGGDGEDGCLVVGG